MPKGISEQNFESDIESTLLSHGPYAPAGTASSPRISEPAPPYGDALPGGYYRRDWKSDYDRERCLVPKDALDFVYATDPQEWDKYRKQHGDEAKDRFLSRLARELEKRGALDVLRRGIKDAGCRFRLAAFRPVSGLNEELRRLYEANRFAVVRQLHFSQHNENSVDLAITLNGIPIFTAELKNPFNGQDVTHAVKQYEGRDPKEPLFAFRRCLAHFAVDPDLVYVTTRLSGPTTRFLPFNKGKFGGAGNPPVPPSEALKTGAYATSYLWNEVWARDSVLNLIQHFVHEFEEEDDKGKRTGKRILIFPRYHQLDAVRRMVRDAKTEGPGKRYLIQHSAGSGKSNSIAWLAHQLSVLHDASDESVFDSVVVVTDRRVLDRQLQRTIRQFEQTAGVVENIDQTSKQLRTALEEGKKIIVTTLQKFPVISEQIGALPGNRFAVIIDEAHSSQSGESTKHLKKVLSVDDLGDAEREDQDDEPDLEDRIAEEVRSRGPQKNVSLFAFTATPKPKTLELFGVKRPDGKFEPFSLYSMRQAIEERFILDVLENYTTYSTYWRLLKAVEDDPRYEKGKATYLLKSFVDLHPNSIEKKISIMTQHFHDQVARQIDGHAKAMIVTRSRLHAVRYIRALRKHLEASGYPYKALVAFSGSVKDGAGDYTEANLNGIPDTQTARTFGEHEYRFLVVANKFQTGFDQPLLHTMYVDKKLGGVNAVQTLSRLNRMYPGKKSTAVLDFANDAAEIEASFQPYYERTLLSEETDPNLLYDLERQLEDFHVYDEADLTAFARLYFRTKSQAVLYAALGPNEERFAALDDEEKVDFRKLLVQFIRLYSFLSQIVPFADTDLEKLYIFARLLRKRLPVDRVELPREVQEKIDLESLRIRETGSGKIRLERGSGELDPIKEKPGGGSADDPEEFLSRIISELNDRFGAELTPEDRVTLRTVMARLDDDTALDSAVRTNTRENVRLTFDHKANDSLQDIVDSNFKLYKRVTDDPAFGEAIRDYMFDLYMNRRRSAFELIKLGESKTVEFKSSLRWNLREGKKDPKVVTHSVLKTIAAFLNTEGGDLLIGVADDGSIVGTDIDQLGNADKFMLHLTHVVAAALGDRSGSCIDPRMQEVDGKSVCVVSCQRSPEPVWLKWKDTNVDPEGDFFIRSGPGTVRLEAESAGEFVRTRWGAR
ncbi:MAG: putative DNA binding domain-containing protein [Candidatus Eisenbacteria bacterium]